MSGRRRKGKQGEARGRWGSLLRAAVPSAPSMSASPSEQGGQSKQRAPKALRIAFRSIVGRFPQETVNLDSNLDSRFLPDFRF